VLRRLQRESNKQWIDESSATDLAQGVPRFELNPSSFAAQLKISTKRTVVFAR